MVDHGVELPGRLAPMSYLGVLLQCDACRTIKDAPMTPVSLRWIAPQTVHVFFLHAILAQTREERVCRTPIKQLD